MRKFITFTVPKGYGQDSKTVDFLSRSLRKLISSTGSKKSHVTEKRRMGTFWAF